jgi:uncharacterized protein (TIGR03083 family)
MDRLGIIAAESARLADVVADSEPGRHCPTCPDWTGPDLLWHLTNVHFFWAGVLSNDVQSPTGLAAIEEAKPPRPAAMTDLLALRNQSTTALLEQLAARDDAEPCWSWWPPTKPSASPAACRLTKRRCIVSTPNSPPGYP